MTVELIIANTIIATSIGCATIYIAYQQYNINRLRLNFEAYDRRLKIYEVARELFSVIGQHGTVKVSDMQIFYSGTAEADFILGCKSRGYIDNLYKKGIKLAFLEKKCT